MPYRKSYWGQLPQGTMLHLLQPPPAVLCVSDFWVEVQKGPPALFLAEEHPVLPQQLMSLRVQSENRFLGGHWAKEGGEWLAGGMG